MYFPFRPSNGGSYCKGVENEYQICGTQASNTDTCFVFILG